MLNFQEQLAKDLDNVFFNHEAKEFVTKHKIGSIRDRRPQESYEFDVVVDQELYYSRTYKDDIENITLDGFVFFIKTSDWVNRFGDIRKIKTGSTLIFDDKMYTVENVAETMGSLQITLSANRG